MNRFAFFTLLTSVITATALLNPALAAEVVRPGDPCPGKLGTTQMATGNAVLVACLHAYEGSSNLVWKAMNVEEARLMKQNRCFAMGGSITRDLPNLGEQCIGAPAGSGEAGCIRVVVGPMTCGLVPDCELGNARCAVLRSGDTDYCAWSCKYTGS